MHCDTSMKWKLLSNKQEQTTYTYNMDDSQEYYAEQDKPDTKADMLYTAICFKFVTKAMSGCLGTAAGGETEGYKCAVELFMG